MPHTPGHKEEKKKIVRRSKLTGDVLPDDPIERNKILRDEKASQGGGGVSQPPPQADLGSGGAPKDVSNLGNFGVPIPTQEQTGTQSGQPEVFRDPRTGRVSGVTLPDGRTFLGLSPDDVQRILSGEAQRLATPEGAVDIGQRARQQQAQQQFGAQPLIAELRQDILDQPSLKPEGVPLVDQFGVPQIVGLGNFATGVLEKVTGKTFGRTTSQELLEQNPVLSRIFGGAILGVEALSIAYGGVAGLTSVLRLRAVATLTAKVTASTGAVGGVLGLGVAGLGAFKGVESITSLSGGKIDSLQQEIAGYSEISSEIIADVEAGVLTPTQARNLIGQMTRSIDEAEGRIQTLGISNVQFRLNEQWRDVQVESLDTRTSLLSALGEIQNLAIRGTKDADLNDLIFRTLKEQGELQNQ